MKILSSNKKVGFHYEILQEFTAGMVLKGWQVKSIKQGEVSIKEAYCRLTRGELFVFGMYIKPWKGIDAVTAKQDNESIKLLLNKRELEKIFSQKEQKGLAVVPTKVFLSRGFIKAGLILGRGLKKHDKRSKIKERDQIKQINAELKNSKYY